MAALSLNDGICLFAHKRESHAVRSAACLEDLHQVDLNKFEAQCTELFVDGDVIFYHHYFPIAKRLHIASVTKNEFAGNINDLKATFFEHF